jgi:hypothetical protein
MSNRFNALVAASLFSLVACAAPTGGSEWPASPPASDDPAEPAPADPATDPDFGTVPESTTPPAPRPAPQATIRSCGRSKTTPTKLEAEARWLDFHPVTAGAKVVTTTPVLLGGQVVSGTVARPAISVTGKSASGPDLDDPAVASALGLRVASSSTTEIENYATSDTITPAGAWYLRPTGLRLNFFSGFNAMEVGWSMSAPHRTSTAAAGDTFVRVVGAGLFAGYQIALEFPDDCAVGALSDALGRPAVVSEALADSGIFAPGKAAAVESALVANGVYMRIRFIGSKRLPAVESAFATTTCSTGNIAGCAALRASLIAASQAFQASSSTLSNLTKLQTNTDPVWSPLRITSAPIATAL